MLITKEMCDERVRTELQAHRTRRLGDITKTVINNLEPSKLPDAELEGWIDTLKPYIVCGVSLGHQERSKWLNLCIERERRKIVRFRL